MKHKRLPIRAIVSILAALCIFQAVVREVIQFQKALSELAPFWLSNTADGSYPSVIDLSAQLEDEQAIPHNFVFHSWGPEGIEFEPILQFINNSYYDYNKVTESEPAAERYGPFVGFVAIHNGSKPMIWFANNVLKRRHVRIIVGERLSRMLVHFQNALGTVLFEYPDRFQAMLQVLEKVGSFPIIMDLGDYESCAKDNYKMPAQNGFVMKSLPIMTMCHTTANCSHYFPVPAYATYDYSLKLKNGTWDAAFKNWSNVFPAMQDKIPKAFWRGSCPRGRFRNRFINQAQRHVYRNFLDVAPTNGGLCGRRARVTSPEESMRYRAVFDIDGNAWSERFPRLLCYNSVVVKVNVDPDFEEYFMPTLTPGVHYLPASMENFSDVAKWAVQDSSLDEINRIVKNANDWCKQRIQSRVLNYDFLTVLNGIVEGLNVNDPTWIDRWRIVQNSYLGTNLQKAHGGFVFQLRDERPTDSALENDLPIVQGLIVTKLPMSQATKPKT